MLYRTKYPVYVLSKGRYENCLTAKFLTQDRIKFYLVVEHHEYKEYKKRFKHADILVLPPESTGRGAIPVRNFIWEHSIATGAKKHWQLDDNQRGTFIRYKTVRMRSHSFINFCAVEHFTDRYTNVGISGMNYVMNIPDGEYLPPFYLNCHVYSTILIKNDLPIRWRGPMNADVDLCLQVFAHGQCTINMNSFCIEKKQTMKFKGGNTAQYKKQDGRLKMARCLVRRWPRLVTVTRKYNRPQHYVKGNYKHFDTQLILKENPDLEFALPYDLVKKNPIQSSVLRDIFKSFKRGKNGKKN